LILFSLPAGGSIKDQLIAHSVLLYDVKNSNEDVFDVLKIVYFVKTDFVKSWGVTK